MTISVGDKVPGVKVMRATETGPQPLTTDELFAGKKVVLFAVPGAFTPTCTQQHLPGFVDQADAIKAKGVDTIACMSVNDPFVLAAWAQSQNVADKVTMVADGNGDFAKAMGLEMDASGFGMGVRSKRFSMIVEDGVVRSLNVDEGGKLDLSGAEKILAQL